MRAVAPIEDARAREKNAFDRILQSAPRLSMLGHARALAATDNAVGTARACSELAEIWQDAVQVWPRWRKWESEPAQRRRDAELPPVPSHAWPNRTFPPLQRESAC